MTLEQMNEMAKLESESCRMDDEQHVKLFRILMSVVPELVWQALNGYPNEARVRSMIDEACAAGARQRVADLKEIEARTRKIVAEMLNQSTSVSASYAALEDERDRLRAELEETHAWLDCVKRGKSAMTEELNDLRKSYSVTQLLRDHLRVKELEQKLSEASAELEQAKSDLADRDRAIKQATAEIERLKSARGERAKDELKKLLDEGQGGKGLTAVHVAAYPEATVETIREMEAEIERLQRLLIDRVPDGMTSFVGMDARKPREEMDVRITCRACGGGGYESLTVDGKLTDGPCRICTTCGGMGTVSVEDAEMQRQDQKAMDTGRNIIDVINEERAPKPRRMKANDRLDSYFDWARPHKKEHDWQSDCEAEGIGCQPVEAERPVWWSRIPDGKLFTDAEKQVLPYTFEPATREQIEALAPKGEKP